MAKAFGARPQTIITTAAARTHMARDDTGDSSPDVAPDGSLIEAERTPPEDNRPPWPTRLRRRLAATQVAVWVRARGVVRSAVRLAALAVVVLAAHNMLTAPITTLPVIAPYLDVTTAVITGRFGTGSAFLSHVAVFVAAGIVAWQA